MKYENPRLNILGPALGMIKSNCTKVGHFDDADPIQCLSSQKSNGFAYEADE
jgi:hypothetical protein